MYLEETKICTHLVRYSLLSLLLIKEMAKATANQFKNLQTFKEFDENEAY